MTTPWQITTLSTRDHAGRYIDEIAGAEDDYERVFDAEEPVASATVELWRITRDDERRSPSSPLEVLVVGGASCVVFGQYVWATCSGLQRHEVYRLVLVLEGVTGGDWARTRHVEAVA